MKQLGDILGASFKRIKPPQASVESECVRVIAEITGFELERTAITYVPTTRTLKVSAPSLVKQEIKLHSETILQKLHTKLGVQSAPTVIL